MYQQIIKTIKSVVDHDYLYLAEAIEVPTSEFTPPFPVWGLSVSYAGVLHVMDSAGHWHEVDNIVKNWALIEAVGTYCITVEKLGAKKEMAA